MNKSPKLANLIKNLNLVASKAFGYSNQHACAVFKKGRIISIGRNKKVKRPLLRRLKYRNCWLHAEADAILKAPKSDLKGATLLVIRTGKTKLRNSKPCPACQTLISESGIGEVFFSTKDGTIGDLADTEGRKRTWLNRTLRKEQSRR